MGQSESKQDLSINDFQSELQQRRRLAEEKYKADSALYLAQSAAKYDTDDYVDQRVTKLKEAALQAADRNEAGFSIFFYRFMDNPQFRSVESIRELEKKIIHRIIDKFCAESGLRNDRDTNVFNRGVIYTIFDAQISIECRF